MGRSLSVMLEEEEKVIDCVNKKCVAMLTATEHQVVRRLSVSFSYRSNVTNTYTDGPSATKLA